MTLDQIKTRDEAVDFLDGYAVDARDDARRAGHRRPLVKSYLLETAPPGRPQPSLEDIFTKRGATLIPIDSSLSKIQDRANGGVIGLLEQLLPRHPVIYTTGKSQDTDAWVRKLVDSSPALDNLWLSGRAFDQLLAFIVNNKPAHRFGRIVFQHQSIFEISGLPSPEPEDEQAETEDTEESADTDQTPVSAPSNSDDGDDYVPERRSTRFMIIDRLDVLKTLLPAMRDLYNPLHSISQLRFPARGPGGHDFYHNGKATNRSDSFADHRLHVKFVLEIYKAATDITEQATWQAAPHTATAPTGDIVLGAPVLLQFKQPLTQEVFDQFIHATFRRKRNVFRLWGNPIQLGPRKYHVYALDRHLWQPLYLEITDRQIVAIVPRGTCGNSIHRLVTNVQQFLDPDVSVSIGDRSYDDLIKSATFAPKIYDD